MTRWKGNPPAEGIALCSLDGWIVWQLGTRGLWIGIKLTSVEPREGRANYRLSWNPRQQRLARTRDFRELREREPALYRALEAALPDLVREQPDAPQEPAELTLSAEAAFIAREIDSLPAAARVEALRTFRASLLRWQMRGHMPEAAAADEWSGKH